MSTVDAAVGTAVAGAGAAAVGAAVGAAGAAAVAAARGTVRRALCRPGANRDCQDGGDHLVCPEPSKMINENPLGAFAQADTAPTSAQAGTMGEGAIVWMQLLYANEPETHLCALAVYQSSATSFCTRFTLYRTNRDTFNGCRSEDTCDKAGYKDDEINAGNLEFLNTYSVAGNGWAILTLPENAVLKQSECTELSPTTPSGSSAQILEIEAYRELVPAPSAPPSSPPLTPPSAPPSPPPSPPPSLSPSPPAPNPPPPTFDHCPFPSYDWILGANGQNCDDLRVGPNSIGQWHDITTDMECFTAATSLATGGFLNAFPVTCDPNADSGTTARECYPAPVCFRYGSNGRTYFNNVAHTDANGNGGADGYEPLCKKPRDVGMRRYQDLDTCSTVQVRNACTEYEDEIMWSRMCEGCGAAHGLDDILPADKNTGGGPSGNGLASYSYFVNNALKTQGRWGRTATPTIGIQRTPTWATRRSSPRPCTSSSTSSTSLNSVVPAFAPAGDRGP